MGKKKKVRVSDDESLGSEQEAETQDENPSSSTGKSLYEVCILLLIHPLTSFI